MLRWQISAYAILGHLTTLQEYPLENDASRPSLAEKTLGATRFLFLETRNPLSLATHVAPFFKARLFFGLNKVRAGQVCVLVTESFTYSACCDEEIMAGEAHATRLNCWAHLRRGSQSAQDIATDLWLRSRNRRVTIDS
jgi:hypothetical protein